MRYAATSCREISLFLPTKYVCESCVLPSAFCCARQPQTCQVKCMGWHAAHLHVVLFAARDNDPPRQGGTEELYCLRSAAGSRCCAIPLPRSHLICADHVSLGQCCTSPASSPWSLPLVPWWLLLLLYLELACGRCCCCPSRPQDPTRPRMWWSCSAMEAPCVPPAFWTCASLTGLAGPGTGSSRCAHSSTAAWTLPRYHFWGLV